MLSQVKRKQKLLLALTLMVLFTSSILAFSIQAAYSTEELFGAYNFLLSGSNAQTAIEQVQKELKGIQDDARIEGDETLAISIDNVVIKLDVVKKSLDEMDKFFSVMNDELQSLKQGLNSDSNEVAVESIRQTTEPTTDESVSVTIDPEKKDFTEGPVQTDVFGTDFSLVETAGGAETLFYDSWVIVIDEDELEQTYYGGKPFWKNKVVIVIDEPILGDEMSGKFIEYLKVTLSDARIASIVENERTGISGLGQDDLLTKAAVAPELQPKDIKSIVPPWVRNNAGWYAEGLITEEDFVVGLKWMINNGVIQLAVPVGIGEEGVS